MFQLFVEENTEAREELRDFIARLSDQDLARPLGDGWTMAGILGHLAFWDYRALQLLKKWEITGVKTSPADADTINDAMRPLLLAIPPRRAAAMAMEAAAAVDKEIVSLPRELISQIESQATTFRLNRGAHRKEHIGQMESALSLDK